MKSILEIEGRVYNKENKVKVNKCKIKFVNHNEAQSQLNLQGIES